MTSSLPTPPHRTKVTSASESKVVTKKMKEADQEARKIRAEHKKHAESIVADLDIKDFAQVHTKLVGTHDAHARASIRTQIVKKKLDALSKGEKNSIATKVKTTKTGKNRRRSTVELADASKLVEKVKGGTSLPPI